SRYILIDQKILKRKVHHAKRIACPDPGSRGKRVSTSAERLWADFGPASREPARGPRQQRNRWEIALPLTRRPRRALAVVRCPASTYWRLGAGMVCRRASAQGTPDPGTA